jgi:hypothetical protein
VLDNCSQNHQISDIINGVKDYEKKHSGIDYLLALKCVIADVRKRYTDICAYFEDLYLFRFLESNQIGSGNWY